MAEQDFQRLLGIMQQLRIELDLANQSISSFSKRFQQTGAEEFNRALAQQRRLAEDLTKQLSEAVAAYNNLNRAAGNTRPPVGNRPGEYYVPTPEEESARFTGARGASFRRKTAVGGVDLSFLDDEAALSKKEEAEARRLKTLQATAQAEEKYAQALNVAREKGFSILDLKNVYNRGTNIDRLQFQRQEPGGFRRDLDLYVNQQGRATPGISNQFRTFGQGVVRDIGELTKWSIALAAVYGPLNKLSELTQTMIENQVKLTDAVVSVSSAFLDQGQIFDIAANQAEQVGEAVSGVIDAFTQAYRATGGAGNQVERLATSQKLLSDSLILSKLSTLDQAQAIDTLSAALRQSGSSINAMNNPLENGTALLDKWVRVTKIANVDLGSLATGFAVLGDAAEAAQIDADELNGVLAAIAETGVASGRELANTARAIVAGFQSEQAREQLENLGIAFADSTGTARPFLEIMKEISDLRIQGVISDTEFSRLTLALGGGTRRQAAYATFIENFSRVGEVASESARASGDAESALAKQLETVQTSVTKLGSAFDSLAQTMGQEGGFLSIIRNSVDGTTVLVKTFDSLVSMLGKATPALTAFVAASLVLKSRGVPSIQAGIGGLLAPQQTSAYDPREVLRPQLFSQRSRELISTNLLGTNVQSGAFQGIVASLIPALSNIFNKEDRFGATKAGANVLGGVAGGIIGSLTGAGPIIGATIGTAISEAFVNSTIARRTDLFGYTAPSFGEARPTGQGEDLDAALEQAEIKLYESIGLGSEALGRFLTSAASQNAEAYIKAVNEAIESQSQGALDRAFGQLALSPTGPDVLKQLEQAGLGQEAIQEAFKSRQQIQFQPEYLAFQQASPEAQRAFREAEAARLAAGGTGQEERTAFSQLVTQNQSLYKELLASIKEGSAQTLRGERVSGDVTGAAYGRRVEALGGFSVKALQYYTALGDQVSKIADDTGTAAEAFETLNNVIVYGSEDALPQMTALTGEITNLVNLLSDPALNEETISKMFPEEGIEGANARLSELRETLANLITDANQQALLGRINIPEVKGDITQPLTPQDFQLVLGEAKRLQDSFYEGFLNLPDDLYDGLKDSWEEWAQIIEDSGETFFQTVSEIDPQFFEQALSKLAEEQRLQSRNTNPFGIQQVDLPSSRSGELQAMVNYFTQYLASNFPQYQQNPEDVGIIYNDYITSVLHGDNLAIKLALEKLVDLNQKQLDGMYNIPEGATFWVPLTAAYYRNRGGAGEGGLPAVGNEPIPTGGTDNTQALRENTSALKEFKGGILGEKERRGELDRFWMKNDPDRFRRERREDTRERAINPREQIYAIKEEKAAGKIETGGRGIEEILDSISTFFQRLFTPGGPLAGFTGAGRGLGSGFTGSPTPGQIGGNFGNRVGDNRTQVNTQPVSKLDLKLSATTTLTLDGRILASALQTYLASDLLRTEGTQGTITRRYIL